jgi:ligand-binding SRPBCC domain-containing protein
MKASECKCIECGKQAVAFWPVCDPDIPSHPYCRECLDKAKMELMMKLFGKGGTTMTQEDKQLLLVDLCARLPYGVKVQHQHQDYLDEIQTIERITREYGIIETESVLGFVDDFKPYLRPMSSMTEAEKEEYRNECNKVLSMPFKINGPYPIVDWLNAHHFDHRGLIEKGLAIEAPEGMYKTK